MPTSGRDDAAHGLGSALPPPPPHNPMNERTRRSRGDSGENGGDGGSAGGAGAHSHNDRRRRWSGDNTGAGGNRSERSVAGSERSQESPHTRDRDDHRRSSRSRDENRRPSVNSGYGSGSTYVDGGAGGDLELQPAYMGSSSGHRQGRGAAAPPPRVVHRVGMECLSPINIAKGDGTSTGGES